MSEKKQSQLKKEIIALRNKQRELERLEKELIRKQQFQDKIRWVCTDCGKETMGNKRHYPSCRDCIYKKGIMDRIGGGEVIDVILDWGSTKKVIVKRGVKKYSIEMEDSWERPEGLEINEVVE